MVPKLTPRQARFVEEYLVDLNGKQAAIRAGYSARSAEVTASRLLSNAKVARAIDDAKRARSEATEIDSEWVLRNAVALYERCIGDVRPAFGRDGRPLRDDDGNPLYRFEAATAARLLELIGRHVKVNAWEHRVRVEGSDLMERILAARRRVSPVIDVDAEVVEEAPRLPASERI